MTKDLEQIIKDEAADYAKEKGIRSAYIPNPKVHQEWANIDYLAGATKYASLLEEVRKENEELLRVVNFLRNTKGVYILRVGEAAYQSAMDIESVDLNYTEPWSTHVGMQCNFPGDHEKYERIMTYCRAASELIKKIHSENQQNQ